ncbi:hypothetical protein BJ138DRAFT_546349 [Hygrophoropsis aurantiaca]|uniref:Uncharacterized protein n=1 Tax=Hygrophoropsis aurantiaca TaxID=72124 RepID=A0ACB8A2U2_9AGAM|nr:hypothetical protein BJ138DRAFT_546349 [Hygrophoropsis aurantiaca]
MLNSLTIPCGSRERWTYHRVTYYSFGRIETKCIYSSKHTEFLLPKDLSPPPCSLRLRCPVTLQLSHEGAASAEYGTSWVLFRDLELDPISGAIRITSFCSYKSFVSAVSLGLSPALQGIIGSIAVETPPKNISLRKPLMNISQMTPSLDGSTRSVAVLSDVWDIMHPLGIVLDDEDEAITQRAADHDMQFSPDLLLLVRYTSGIVAFESYRGRVI